MNWRALTDDELIRRLLAGEVDPLELEFTRRLEHALERIDELKRELACARQIALHTSTPLKDQPR